MGAFLQKESAAFAALSLFMQSVVVFYAKNV